MKRKVLAVAVGALFVAPAAQAQITFGNEQIGTLQIYGKLYPQFGWTSFSNSTQPGAAVATFQGGGVGTVAAPLTNTVPAGAAVAEPLPNPSQPSLVSESQSALSKEWRRLTRVIRCFNVLREPRRPSVW